MRFSANPRKSGISGFQTRMLQLISHIVRTSAKRDRTEINAALIDAMADLFHPVSVTIYRCYASSRGTMILALRRLTTVKRDD